jgi:hypothetical protein
MSEPIFQVEPKAVPIIVALRRSMLAFSNWLPFLFGAGYGIVARLFMVFGDRMLLPDRSGVMSAAFVVLVPVAIGAITVYCAEREYRRSVGYYLAAPCVSVGLFLLGTAILLIEGSICIAMAAPLFLGFGALGGLIAGLLMRVLHVPGKVMHCVALLPMLLVFFELRQPLPKTQFRLQETILIQAPPELIWQQINNPLAIQRAEMQGGLAYRIGVPYPLEARTLEPKLGGLRQLRWEGGVGFDEVITAWQPAKFIAWNYRFDKNSFPPGSMDQHVVVGGSYFDLLDTSYTLSPESGGTRLSVNVGYRVSTGFNFYAKPIGNYLIRDTARTILKFYQRRSEALAMAQK